MARNSGLPHLLVEDNDVGKALPDQLSKGGSRIPRCLCFPERFGLDRCDEDDDEESTEDGSGVLPNRSKPVALLVDGVQQGETGHADLINKQNRPPLPEQVELPRSHTSMPRAVWIGVPQGFLATLLIRHVKANGCKAVNHLQWRCTYEDSRLNAE
jgi:hypothetical protein